MKQYAALDDVIYLWFASNDTSGSGGDGASAAADVRLAGAAASAAPVYSPTPTLLSHADYPAGSYEIAITASAANGFAANNTYAVFCTLAIDSQNPTGFVGSFDLKPVESNLIRIGDVAQSATDLKDFADAGYEPTAHKIQGVVLCDTTTTNTDMVGTSGANTTTPPTVAEIRTEMEGAGTKLTNTLDDTNELQSNQSDWATATGFNTVVPDAAGVAPTAVEIRQEMDTNSTKMAPSQNLADYKATGFNTVVPDAAGIAATPTEVATALTDIHLDHLLAVAYDPAAKPGSATALWNELIESDGGISRYTANALEQAPSAGTNPNVLIDTTIATVTDQTHFTLTAGSNDDDAYKDQAIVVYDASDSDFPSVRKCSGYVGSTKTITIDAAPDFTIASGDGCKAFVTAPGTTAPTAGQNADAVCDELLSAHTIAGSLAKSVSDTLVDTDELQTNQGSWLTATGFNTTTPDAAGTAAALHVTTDGKVDAVQSDLDNPNQYKADVSTLAIEANIEGHVSTSLSAYDSPTRAEATADKDELIADHLTMKQVTAGTYNRDTDSLQAIRDGGDSAWTTATGFNTVVPDAQGTAAGLHATTDALINGLDDITVADIIAGISDGTYDLQEMMRIMFSALSGKSSGGGTVTLQFRDGADIKNRITATVDASGNRTAVSRDGS